MCFFNTPWIRPTRMSEVQILQEQISAIHVGMTTTPLLPTVSESHAANTYTTL